MGCGESKHDVATGNTITRKKSNAGEISKKSKDIVTVLENASLLVQQQQEEEADHQKGDQVAVDDHRVKDIAENTETKESLITKESPYRYFSSRKEEESIEGIEGRSEKSEYDSPRPEFGKESLFNDSEKVDEKKLSPETISEAENAEAVSEKKEENLSKEKEKTAAVKAEASVSAPAASAGAEKNHDNAKKEQEQFVASASKDLKTV